MDELMLEDLECDSDPINQCLSAKLDVVQKQVRVYEEVVREISGQLQEEADKFQAAKTSVQVSHVWRRICGDKIALGIVLENGNNSLPTRLRRLLLRCSPSPAAFQYTQTTFSLLPTATSAVSVHRSDILPPSTRSVIVAAFDTPNFTEALRYEFRGALLFAHPHTQVPIKQIPCIEAGDLLSILHLSPQSQCANRANRVGADMREEEFLSALCCYECKQLEITTSLPIIVENCRWSPMGKFKGFYVWDDDRAILETVTIADSRCRLRVYVENEACLDRFLHHVHRQLPEASVRSARRELEEDLPQTSGFDARVYKETLLDCVQLASDFNEDSRKYGKDSAKVGELYREFRKGVAKAELKLDRLSPL